MKGFAILLCLVVAAIAVDFVSVESVQNPETSMVVNFLDSAEPAGSEHIKVLETLEGDELFDGYRFVVVDKQSDDNTEFFNTAFAGAPLPMVFLVNKAEGIDRVDGTSAEAIRTHMEFKAMVGDDSKVLTMTSRAEIDELLAGDKPVIFKMFEQWCGHCKHLAPVFVKAATANENAVFAEIECSLNDETKQFCNERGVRGFPTINVAINNDFVLYNQARSVPAINSFLDLVVKDPEAMIAADKARKAAEEAQEAEAAKARTEAASQEAVEEEVEGKDEL